MKQLFSLILALLFVGQIAAQQASSKDLEEAVVDEWPIYNACDDMALMGKALRDCGDKELYKFIYSNIEYSKEAIQKDIEGRIYIQFDIDENGNMSNASIKSNDLGYGIGKSAMEIVNIMIAQNHKWIPAVKNGENVAFTYVLPLKIDTK